MKVVSLKSILQPFFSLLFLSSIILSPLARAFSHSGNTYTIKKGHHYASGIHFGHFKGSELKMSFQFDDGAMYTSNSPENQLDVNKLFGMTDCNKWSPTENSVRFGWRWVNQKIEILAYVDYQGKHEFQVLGSTQPGQVESGSIRLEGGKYAFYFKGNRIEMTRHCSKSKIKGYELFPYFGGNETAPHKIKIWLKQN